MSFLHERLKLGPAGANDVNSNSTKVYYTWKQDGERIHFFLFFFLVYRVAI
jgi:hypothetical protein